MLKLKPFYAIPLKILFILFLWFYTEAIMKEKRKGKYGYVEFIDKRKLRYDGYDDNRKIRRKHLPRHDKHVDETDMPVGRTWRMDGS